MQVAQLKKNAAAAAAAQRRKLIEEAGRETAAYKATNPAHYRAHPSGVECITITEHMGFNLGNAVKYLWRSSLKGGADDLRKAVWYIEREIGRLEGRGRDTA